MARAAAVRVPVERRLVRRTKSEGECLVWTGHRDSRGYGHISVDRVNKFSHRVAWELANGPIPDGMFVCHHCDNPPCLRIEHLYLGTPLQNTRDAIARGHFERWGSKVTHCPKGHEYSGSNVRMRRGSRACRACEAASAETALRDQRRDRGWCEEWIANGKPRSMVCSRGHEKKLYSSGRLRCLPCNAEREHTKRNGNR